METLKSKTFTISAENVREKSQQYHYEKGQKKWFSKCDISNNSIYANTKRKCAF